MTFIQLEMQILILTGLSLVWGIAPKNPASSSVPEKLRVYQNATGLNEDIILSLFQKSLEGKTQKIQ